MVRGVSRQIIEVPDTVQEILLLVTGLLDFVFSRLYVSLTFF